MNLVGCKKNLPALVFYHCAVAKKANASGLSMCGKRRSGGRRKQIDEDIIVVTPP